MTRRPLAWALLLAALVSGCASPPQDRPQRVLVFAAASLHGAFEEIARVVEDEHPDLDVVVSSDGSAALVDQLIGGGRADVLATADTVSMSRAVDAELTARPPEVFATNVLTLVTPPTNPAGISGFDTSLTGTRLVVCAPTVPCGRATATLAARRGLTLSPVSEETKVTDVLGKVTSGEADAGVVYATDARAAGDAVRTLPLEGAEEVPNLYAIAPLRDAVNRAGADAFIAGVGSERGRAVLAGRGFGAP